MDTNQLTQKTREVLQTAQSLTISQQHQQLEVAHLLLAILNQEASFINEILKKMQKDPERLRQEAESLVHGFPKVIGEAEKWTRFMSPPRLI
jgi:ATP-dependent Clp protease ATP-binding subunit ClpB